MFKNYDSSLGPEGTVLEKEGIPPKRIKQAAGENKGFIFSPEKEPQVGVEREKEESKPGS